MPKLIECLVKNRVPKEVQDYLIAQKEKLMEGGMDEGDASRKAITDLQQETLNSLADIHKQAGTGSGDTTPPPAEQQPVVTEGEGDMTGITHAQMDETAEEFGLPTYEKDPETIEGWDKQADELTRKYPNIVNKILDKMKRDIPPEPVETRVMIKYIASLKARIRANPTQELLGEFNRAKNLLNIVGGRKVGKMLVARQGMKPVADDLATYLSQEAESLGVETLPQEDIDKLTSRYYRIEELKKIIDKAKEEGRREAQEKRANEEVNKEKKKSSRQKKSHEDYVKERKDAVDAAREALKKLRTGESGLSAVPLPGVRELIAISPHVTKVFKSLVSEGVSKLEDVVDALHEEFKNVLDGISKDQIRGIIAGEYNERKETKDELTAQIRQLRKEAKNPEVEKRKQIEAKIRQLKERLDKHDYAKEEKAPPRIKLSKETQKLQDELYELEAKDRGRRAKAEYDKLSKWQKRFDLLWQALGLRRLIQTGIDFSIPLRQAVTITLNPFRGNITAKAFADMFTKAFNVKAFNRYMQEILDSDVGKEFLHFDGVLSDPTEQQLDKREEEFRTTFVHKFLNKETKAARVLAKIWFSERAAAAFLNTARIELYQAKSKTLMRQGLTPESDPQAYKDIVKWIMNSTGRGNMLKLIEDSHAGRVAANNTFFGARLMASRINMLNPVYYAKMPYEVRIEALKDMAGYVSGLMMAGLALVAAGGSVGLDPDDPDFLKVRFGETTYDLTGGMGNYVRTYIRAIKAIWGDKKYKKFATNSAVKSLLEHKLSPNTSYVYDYFTGRTGEDPREFEAGAILEYWPLYAEDVVQAYKDSGWTSAATVLIPSVLGVGVQAYPEKQGYEPKDMKEPTFKYFLDRGLELPNTIPESIEVKDKETKTIKKLTDFGEEKVKEYLTERKKALKSELDEYINKGYVYVDEYGAVSKAESRKEKLDARYQAQLAGRYNKSDKKLKKIDDLNEDQLIRILSNSAKQATEKTKEKLFPE